MPSPANSRPIRNRRPLGDGTQSANILSKTPQRSPKPNTASPISSTGLPHHESLMANGGLTVRDITTSPENKRVSAVTNDSNHDSKRDSQASNASTTASSGKGRRKTHIGPWQLGRDIGQGYSCKVRKVRHTVTGQQAAVKIIDKKIAEQGRSESLANLAEVMKQPASGVLAATGNIMPFGIEREVVILKLLEHPNVVKLYDVWENRNQLYLIMEYVDGGELFDYVADQDCLPEDETVWLFRQMVAALLHCHRLGIHHRDLKPENILIETADDSLLVKLADFGMAALQPRGKQLTTACGSVHYAAPEVFERRYDGSKVDVWSLGVILYVMLTGTTPFTYDQQTMANDVGLWYSVIKSGIYPMPEGLSDEAQDLIARMLKPDPRYRISLEGVWNHPFIHKYEEEWGEEEGVSKLENWIGPQPIIETWTIKTREDIDREIFRNLRTLWHSEKEESLISKILSAEPNQEKYFYFALQKHRDEQLENYVRTPESVTYSTSDYHHLKAKQNEVPTIRTTPAVRTNSQYSILNNEHLQSRASLVEPPSSIRSYDPFRASRDPIIGGKENNYTSVVVHRGLSQQSRQSGRSNSCHPSSLRVESLRRSQRRLSTASSTNSLKHSSPRYSSMSAKSRAPTIRSISRSSIANSPLHSSPPIVIKPSLRHKKAVNFSHRRRLSTVRTSAASTSDLLTVTPQKHSNQRDLSFSPSPSAKNHPLGLEVKQTRAKDKSVDEKGNRAYRTNIVVDSEARKVSTELEKFCEEAFNRSSAGSSHRTSATTSQVYSETPPSSVSHTKSLISNQDAVQISLKTSTTPSQRATTISSSPSETPNTFIARELAETRKRFAAKYANDQTSHSDHYLEVLAHLDSLLKPSTPFDKRTTSLPEPRLYDLSPQLPVISEDKSIDADGSSVTSKESHQHDKDSSGTKENYRNLSGNDKTKSIRIVEDSSPPRPAPLVIRKASKDSISGCSTSTPSSRVKFRMDGAWSAHQLNLTSRATPTTPESLDTISEEQKAEEIAEQPPTGTDTPAAVKKKNWWRRKHSVEEKNAQNDKLRDNAHHSRPDSRNEMSSKLSDRRPGPNNMSGALLEHSGQSIEKRSNFRKLFGRKWTSKRTKETNLANDIANELRTKATITSAASPTSSDFTTSRILEPGERSDFRDLGVQQNWLARFLHIKPAVKIVCFQVTRGRARAEITRLLKSWRPHGIKDVELDRERNLIFGRLDSVNALGYKAVEFVAEVFVVLEKGRRKGLSIARFTQRKGAASSFRRIVDEVETRLTSKGVVVMEKEVKREMELLLAENDAK